MNNKLHNKMKDQTTIDLGPTLVTIDVESGHTRNLLLFTFFVNGISIRSSNMHLPAVRDRILDGVWLMAGAVEHLDITRQMRIWVNSKVEGQQS